jgi:hypothetical protein
MLAAFVSVLHRLTDRLTFKAASAAATAAASAATAAAALHCQFSAAKPWKSFAKSLTASLPHHIKPPRENEAEKKGLEFFLQPRRPTGMCEAQRIDFNAACERRITWRQYFEKWGRQGLSL